MSFITAIRKFFSKTSKLKKPLQFILPFCTFFLLSRRFSTVAAEEKDEEDEDEEEEEESENAELLSSMNEEILSGKKKKQVKSDFMTRCRNYKYDYILFREPLEIPRVDLHEFYEEKMLLPLESIVKLLKQSKPTKGILTSKVSEKACSKKKVKFDTLTIHFFNFAQSFTTVTSDLETSLGMEETHFFSMSESLNNPDEVFDLTSIIAEGERGWKRKPVNIEVLTRWKLLDNACVKMVVDPTIEYLREMREDVYCKCESKCDVTCPCNYLGLGCKRRGCSCCSSKKSVKCISSSFGLILSQLKNDHILNTLTNYHFPNLLTEKPTSRKSEKKVKNLSKKLKIRKPSIFKKTASEKMRRKRVHRMF